MIDLLISTHNSAAYPHVIAAFARSVSRNQLRQINTKSDFTKLSRILVLINPEASILDLIQKWRRLGPAKLIIFGKLPSEFLSLLELASSEWPDTDNEWSQSPLAQINSFAESPAQIVYNENAFPLAGALWRRPLERFDFSNEWNNLGFGAISNKNSIWSLSTPAIASLSNSLADVVVEDKIATTYCSLLDDANVGILWYNREVGPIDSFEWRLVEKFLSSWRYGELPCQPILSEIPWGFSAAVTMRLDCDEDIESSRKLRAMYHELNVPFSLAIHTSVLNNIYQHDLIKEMTANGESILSHTATHAPNWGGSYESAFQEAYQSRNILKEITGRSVRYAVSPFHHCPQYALAALADVGYLGCIGGIISSDPEFLTARGGLVSGINKNFVGHSQQCMLHGDCLLNTTDPLGIYKLSFLTAYQTKTMFGYLDHPLSDRYQYGWASEKSRIDVHEQFISYMRGVSDSVVFLSENDAMNFLLDKSKIEIIAMDGEYIIGNTVDYKEKCSFMFSIEYGENIHKVERGKYL